MAHKKKKLNGFAVYMLETQQILANQGIKMSMASMTVYCKNDWDEMPHDMKNEYKTKSKTMDKEVRLGKYTSTGENVDNIKKQSNDCKIQSDVMYNYIEELVHIDPPRYFIPKTKFILIQINSYTCEKDEFFFPAEVTMAEFSLEKGLTRFFHQLLGFDKAKTCAPVASSADINHHARYNHQISTFYKLPNNYKETFLKLIGFIVNKEVNENMLTDSTLDMPPIYTAHTSSGNELHTTTASLFQLCKTAMNNLIKKDNFNNILRVYQLDKLFMEIKNASHRSTYLGSNEMAIPSVAIATENLNKNFLNTIKKIGCTFHEKLEHPHVCSNYYICKWIYIFSIHSCHYFNIKLISNYHYDFDLSKSEIPVQSVVYNEISNNYVQCFKEKKNVSINNFPVLEGKSTVDQQSILNCPKPRIHTQEIPAGLVSNKDDIFPLLDSLVINSDFSPLDSFQIPTPKATEIICAQRDRGRDSIVKNNNLLALSNISKKTGRGYICQK